MLAVRLSRCSSDLVPFFDKVNDHCDQCIWFEHRADGRVSRTHVHGLIDGLRVSVETMKNWLRYDTLWAPTQNWERSDWSFKTQYKNPVTKVTQGPDKHMITYMSKGSLAPCHMPKGFDDWKEYRKAWVEPRKVQTTLDPKIELPEDHDSKITQWEMLTQVKARMSLHKDPTDRDLISEIIYVHKLHHKLISRYKIRDFYDSYHASYNKEGFIDMIFNLCNKT